MGGLRRGWAWALGFNAGLGGCDLACLVGIAVSAIWDGFLDCLVVGLFSLGLVVI